MTDLRGERALFTDPHDLIKAYADLLDRARAYEALTRDSKQFDSLEDVADLLTDQFDRLRALGFGSVTEAVRFLEELTATVRRSRERRSVEVIHDAPICCAFHLTETRSDAVECLS